jgi:hypothetical protein
MDFISWDVYVNDQSARKNMHVPKGMKFGKAQNVKDSYVGSKLYHVYLWLWIGLGNVENESCLTFPFSK